MKNSPKVAVGQIWVRPDGSRILVCRLKHPAIPSTHGLDQRVAEIRSLSRKPDMLDFPIGPPSYPLLENFPKYYRYRGMRQPYRPDLLEIVDGTNSGTSFMLVEGLMYQHRLRQVYLCEYFPFRKKKRGERSTQVWDEKQFWRSFAIVGTLRQEEY